MKINFPICKQISQNENMFRKIKINLLKCKISQNENMLHKMKINFKPKICFTEQNTFFRN